MTQKKAWLATTDKEYQKLGLKRGSIQQFEDGLRTTGAKGEFEWWYYDAKMADGSTLVVTFFSNNATDGSGGFHPSIKIELTKPDGTEVKDRVYFDSGEASFDTKRCNVQLGQNFFRGDLHRYHIYIKTAKIEAEIRLTGNVSPWRSETGHIYFGEEKYFAWLPAVPEGVTEARVTVAGTTTSYHGTGYHDHNWGNAPMMAVLHHWYWGRAKIGPYTVISCYLTSTKKYGYTHLPIFMIAKGGEVVCDNGNKVAFEQIQPTLSQVTKKHYHQQLVYDYQGQEGHYRITYKVQDLLASFSLLEDEGQKPALLQQLMVKLMGLDPTYDRFDGPARLEKIDNGKVVESYTNQTTWELMYFKKDQDV